MKPDFSKHYLICEEPAPFGIKIGTSVEQGLKTLYHKKGNRLIRRLMNPFKAMAGLFAWAGK